MRLKKQFDTLIPLLIAVICFTSLAQYGQYSARSLLKKKIFYVANGKIGSCEYWSLPLGKFDCTLNKYFPGEGEIDIQATLNFAVLSSNYIEGWGYGERGKVGSEAHFAIADGDSVKVIGLDDIDYIFNNGKMVKLKNQEATPLILSCYVNKLNVRRMQIMIWRYDKKFHELKHFKDINNVTAFSFTKQGALRALKANKGN